MNTCSLLSFSLTHSHFIYHKQIKLKKNIDNIRDITKDDERNDDDDDIKNSFTFIWQMESTYKLPRSIYDFFSLSRLLVPSFYRLSAHL